MIPEADVVVIGAGIVGVASAFYLAKAGRRVVVVDRGAVAGEASGRNGGHLAPTIDGAWAPLGLLALATWPELVPDIDGPTEYRRGGGLYVVVADDPTDPADILAYRHAQGFVAEQLSPEDSRALLPALASDIKGGVLSPRHGQVNPILTTKSLARTAIQAGAQFRLQTEVTGVLTRNDRVDGVTTNRGPLLAPVVVNAAGAWAGRVAALAGVECPVGPRRIQILLSESVPLFTELIWGGNGLYGRQAQAGHLHFGAGDRRGKPASPISTTAWRRGPCNGPPDGWSNCCLDWATCSFCGAGRGHRTVRRRRAGAGGVRVAARVDCRQRLWRQRICDWTGGGQGGRCAGNGPPAAGAHRRSEPEAFCRRGASVSGDGCTHKRRPPCH